jgi:glycerophosphoryl diester phosphodiesterase
MRLFLIATVWIALSSCTSPNGDSADPNDSNRSSMLYNDNEDGFTLIAHRGASGHAPENTLVAVRRAMEMRAEMVEVDILLSKDGIPLLLHDPSLDRTTNGSGVVSDYTMDELKLLDAGSWFGDQFAGERIPTVDELLELCKGKMALNLEIKTQAVTDTIEGGIVEKVVELVRRHGMERNVIFSSFDPRAIKHLKTIAPDIAGAILYDNRLYDGKHPVDIVSELGADAFNCHWRQVRPTLVDSLHEVGVPINVYTVNSDTLMHQMLEMGVNGIFTDFPDVLLQVLRDRNPIE